MYTKCPFLFSFFICYIKEERKKKIERRGRAFSRFMEGVAGKVSAPMVADGDLRAIALTWQVVRLAGPENWPNAHLF